jgi:hypothetical protein
LSHLPLFCLQLLVPGFEGREFTVEVFDCLPDGGSSHVKAQAYHAA